MQGMDTLHIDRDEGFEVYRERFGDQRYFLVVLCGNGIAQYSECRLEMNTEEVEWFRHDTQQLKTLARQVRHWPHRFTGRLQPI